MLLYKGRHTFWIFALSSFRITFKAIKHYLYSTGSNDYPCNIQLEQMLAKIVKIDLVPFLEC